MGRKRLIVLDTHTWWWALSEPDSLSPLAAQTIRETPPHDIRIAAISLWELALLLDRGRILLSIPPERWLPRALDESGIAVEPLTPDIALEAYRLPEPFHRDPADRLIVATTRVLGARLVTRDGLIRSYPHVQTVWD